jgi:hypothetical protein
MKRSSLFSFTGLLIASLWLLGLACGLAPANEGARPAQAATPGETDGGSPPEQTLPEAPQADATLPTDSAAPATPLTPAKPAADDPNPPAQPVKLIFIHHSTGGNWLADPAENSLGGGLGQSLMDNNYFASATNYGWGPDGIGDNTDIGHWWDWFRGPQRATYLEALYTESGQNFGDFGPWPRLEDDPGGENQVILFKSCFPNSHLGGSPADPPTGEDNPLRGAWAGDDSIYTVGNAKGLYNDLLVYFSTRPDKLFIVITAPPLAEWETDSAHAANARALNDWLVHDWLANYPLPNVAVFDYYNVLTSNGGDPDTDDLDQPGGNHHRWRDGAIEHSQAVDQDFSAYPSGDSHPSQAGNRKATSEFLPLLNVFYHRWADGRAQAGKVYLPLAASGTPVPHPSGETDLLAPADLVYLGAFRLPGDGERPFTFAYGGSAITFNPAGDPSGSGDGFAGSLFVMGHDRLPYGELPDGNQVAEISIPAPLAAAEVGALPQAEFIQGFQDVAAGYFAGLDELPRAGMLYLDHPATGPRIHLTWGQHLQPETPTASQAWFSPDLAAPQLQGPWFVGNYSAYSLSGYLMEIPAAWADQYAQARYLGSGRFRDGGWSGMGPALIAYRPWDAAGAPPPPNTRLEATPLLLYASSQDQPEIAGSLANYQHPDEWEGGAWITTPAGKTAVLFAGTKSLGEKYWYGFVNPLGAGLPCVEGEMVDQFTLCRLADGSPCPAEDLVECAGHNDYRGWWTTRFEAQFILYDPADLALVATGELAPWEPQPYAVLGIDEHLYHNPARVESDMLGQGVQRRYRLGEVAYDRANGRLYVLELFADEARPLVHVWAIEP